MARLLLIITMEFFCAVRIKDISLPSHDERINSLNCELSASFSL